ncbi:MAG: hypothetical protein Roseis2KO_56590 [Roseivirga sp.]
MYQNYQIVMPQEFRIKESDDTLALRSTMPVALMALIKELTVFAVACLIVFSFPYDTVLAISPFLLIIYVLPLLRLPFLLKVLQVFYRGRTLFLDKEQGTISIDDKAHAQLTDIARLELNSLSDQETTCLDLIFNKSPYVRISKTGSSKEHKALGRQIARFTGVEFWDNRRYHEELLWGNTQVSDQDIAAVNSRHSRYN